MIRTTLLLVAIGWGNVSYAQKKMHCDAIISICLKENLTIKDSIRFWMQHLNMHEINISQQRFKSKKKLQSLRLVIRSLELVRDSAGCLITQTDSSDTLKIPSFYPIKSSEILNVKNTLPDLPNSKRSRLLNAIEQRNEAFQQNQINLLCHISQISQETKKNFDTLLISMIINQKHHFMLERQQHYQQRIDECEQEMYETRHKLKESIDNVKLTYAKAYRRLLKRNYI